MSRNSRKNFIHIMIDDLVALPFKVTFQVSMKQQHFDLHPSATFNNDVDFFSSKESKGKKSLTILSG